MSKEKKFDSSGSATRQTNNLPYATSRLGAHIELVDIAREIAQADTMINTRVNAKLRVIADQIHHLQQQAREILEEAQHDQQLHHAECNFKRIPGNTYHLYEKNNDQLYFSMLSPEDWGDTPPHSFLGSFRLENDMSWTLVDNKNETQVDDSREIVEQLLNNS